MYLCLLEYLLYLVQTYFISKEIRLPTSTKHYQWLSLYCIYYNYGKFEYFLKMKTRIPITNL